MAKVIVQYHANEQYGEFTARSEELSAQQMVDEMHEKAKPGVHLRFLGEGGILTPTGYQGDARLYIAH